MWKNIDKTNPDGAHYSVIKLEEPGTGMEALRTTFPEAKADELNFVLFSTSGVHGTYNRIEEAESFLLGESDDGFAEVTFVIVHPRLVAMRYGVCNPDTQDDIDYLKALRESSWTVARAIGA